MLTPASALEASGLAPLVPCGAHGAAEEPSPERRKEFENILSHALPRFRRIAMRWLRNPEDAEDAVQDAMLSAFTHIARFDGRAQMSTWLTTIVINAVRMQIRRRPRVQMVSLDQSPREDQQPPAELLADPKPTPEQTLEQCELCELAIKLTAGLPASQRAALRLRQRDDFSTRKAAEKLQIPQGTLKARLARGRVKLMERFRKATETRKNRASVAASQARCRGSASGGRRDRLQDTAPAPNAVFAQPAGYEGWVSA